MGLEDDLKLCGNLPELLSLSRAFSCPVCYELLKGPVVLPCGHSYCSGCIRQNFDFKTSQNQSSVCPTCRQPCDHKDLRASLALREAVNAFKQLPAAVAQQLEVTKQLCNQAHHAAKQEADACTEESSQPENHSLPQQQQSRKRRAVEAPGGGHHQTASEHAATIRRSGRVASAAAAAQAEAPAPRHAVGHNRPAATAAAASQPQPAPSCRGTSSSSVEILSSSVSEHSEGQSGSEARSSGGGGSSASGGRGGWRAERRGPALLKDVRGKSNSKAPAQAQQTPAGSQQGRAPGPAPLPPGYVACPVCGISTRSALLNAHLDSCIARQDEQQQQQQQQQRPSRAGVSSALDARCCGPSPSLSAPAARWSCAHQQSAAQRTAPAGPAPAPMFGSSSQRAVPKAPVIEVPPKLVFNLISDKDLKKRLMALGLPADGKKQDWVDRYQAYRRFLQSKMDEGTRCSQAQLRAGFLLQQRQHTEARRVVPRLDAGQGASYRGAPSSSRPQGLPASTSGHQHQYAELIEQTRARMEAKPSGAGPAGRGAGVPGRGEQPGDPGGRPGEDGEQQEAAAARGAQQQVELSGDHEPGATVAHGRMNEEAEHGGEGRPAAWPHEGGELVDKEQPDWGQAAVEGAAWDEESMQGSGDFICE